MANYNSNYHSKSFSCNANLLFVTKKKREQEEELQKIKNYGEQINNQTREKK